MTEYFKKELELIKNPIVKRIAEEGIALLPEYFYRVPASSTGKYHPSYALGEGGLYRHVLASANIAFMLFRITEFTELEQDIIVTSLILHDGWKQGENGSGNTTHTHPLVASTVLKQNIHAETEEEIKILDTICDNVATHMGKWTTSKWDSTVLPSPQNKMQKFVHLCDYLASRKPLEYNFAVENGA